MICFLLIRLDRKWRRGWLLHVVWRIEALLLGGFWALCRALPPERASALGRRLLAAIGPRLRQSDIVRQNLALVRPELPESELDALVREAWGNYGAVLAEYPHLARLRTEADTRIELHGGEQLDQIARSGRAAVFASAHLGNWNLPAFAAARAGVPLAVVETPMRNPYLARRFDRMMLPMACDLLNREKGPREVLRRLRRGQSVAFLTDVRIDSGVPIPMFGREVPTTLVPARIALSTGCDLVPVRVERTGDLRFRVTFEAPLRPDDPSADAREQALQMTRALNDRFSAWIRERPGQWLCFKRRTAKVRPGAAPGLALPQAASPLPE